MKSQNSSASPTARKKLLLEVQNLTLAYSGGTSFAQRQALAPASARKSLRTPVSSNAVVEDLSFSIFEQDFICLVGHNGSGKSTLVIAMLGLIRPQKGCINYNIKRSAIGYMPQETKLDAHFPASVEEIVETGLLARPSNSVSATLSLLGISDLRAVSFPTLSGGQRQKVLLARAIVAAEKLLILDEPSNNLDQTSRHELYAIIQRLNQNGLAILMITHDLDHDNLLGDKILSLPDQFFGSTQQFVQKIHHRSTSPAPKTLRKTSKKETSHA